MNLNHDEKTRARELTRLYLSGINRAQRGQRIGAQITNDVNTGKDNLTATAKRIHDLRVGLYSAACAYAALMAGPKSGDYHEVMMVSDALELAADEWAMR